MKSFIVVLIIVVIMDAGRALSDRFLGEHITHVIAAFIFGVSLTSLILSEKRK